MTLVHKLPDQWNGMGKSEETKIHWGNLVCDKEGIWNQWGKIRIFSN